MFAAFEESRGFLDMGDVEEGFAIACQSGDPVGAPWWDPTAHGTCEERQNAFGWGYYYGRERIGELCIDPIGTMRSICG